MPRKRKHRRGSELLDITLCVLAGLVKDLSPEARIEISLARYEDEDAHISIFLPPETEAEEVKRIELALGERCNDILVDTGLFIIGAVCD